MQSGETIRPIYLPNLLAQFVSCTPESQQSAALALYCLTIWAVRNRVKSFSVVPCEGQKSAPLATTLTGTEMVRTGRQRSGVVESSQSPGATHTDEFSLRSTLPAAQKQPCMGKKNSRESREYLHRNTMWRKWCKIKGLCVIAICILSVDDWFVLGNCQYVMHSV